MTNFAAPMNTMCQRSEDAPTNVNDRYRGLASKLIADASQIRRGYAVGASSASHGEGVTNTIANLAVSAAGLTESPILLIDFTGNFGLERFLGVEQHHDFNEEGLEYIESRDNTARPTCIPNLCYLKGELNNSHRDAKGWETLLDEAKRNFGLVLLDLPPVAQLSAQTASFGSVDGILMVIEAGRSRQKAVLRAKSLLQRMGIRPLGVVLNKRKTFVPDWLYNKV